jgi:hypothetical protein
VKYKSQPRINLAHRYGHDGIEVVAQRNSVAGSISRVTYDGSSKAAGLKVYDGALNPVDVRRDNLGFHRVERAWRIAWKGTGIGFDGGMDGAVVRPRARGSGS